MQRCAEEQSRLLDRLFRRVWAPTSSTGLQMSTQLLGSGGPNRSYAYEKNPLNDQASKRAIRVRRVAISIDGRNRRMPPLIQWWPPVEHELT